MGHSCEDEQKAGKYMDPEVGVEGRAGGVDLGILRASMKLCEWLRYGRLTKDVYIITIKISLLRPSIFIM